MVNIWLTASFVRGVADPPFILPKVLSVNFFTITSERFNAALQQHAIVAGARLQSGPW
jgi:hypothetical protein